MPSTAEAYASAWAWLPAEMEMTPRCFSSSVSVASLLSTPRGLNEPVRWSNSALNRTSAPIRSDSVADESNGVRCSRPPIRSRARWTSSREISESVVVIVFGS